VAQVEFHVDAWLGIALDADADAFIARLENAFRHFGGVPCPGGRRPENRVENWSW
jgi:hypothetical protein